jgi:hypothetical protein
MLGQTEKKIFLNIAEGKVTRRVGNGRVEKYDFVEGTLERIYKREREFRGEKVLYWYLDIKDTKGGDTYSLGIHSTSGVWRSIILSLGSVESFLFPIKICPYRKGEYDKVVVYSGDTRLDWVSELPPVEVIEVQGEKVKSSVKREKFISDLVDKVNRKIQGL